MNIIWVNGVFDIVHAGHIELFKRASEEGDFVMVAIDDDERVRELKGDSRPINCLEDRMKVLNSIKYINGVFHYRDEDEMKKLIKFYKPTTIVIGEEYKDKRIVGKGFFNKIIYMPKYKDLSSTKILNQKPKLGWFRKIIKKQS